VTAKDQMMQSTVSHRQSLLVPFSLSGVVIILPLSITNVVNEISAAKRVCSG
jgi:hypothetical protein